MLEWNDRDHVDRLAKNDPEAWQEFFGRHREYLEQFARKCPGVRCWDDAEDLVQETYVHMMEGLSRFDGRSSLRTWICKILRNLALDRCRRERHRATPRPAEAEEVLAVLAPGPKPEWALLYKIGGALCDAVIRYLDEKGWESILPGLMLGLSDKQSVAENHHSEEWVRQNRRRSVPELRVALRSWDRWKAIEDEFLLKCQRTLTP